MSFDIMAPSHFERLSNFVVAKVTSYLANDEDDPRDIMNLMIANKSIKESIKSNFVLKPAILDIKHFLMVTKNLCGFLQDLVTSYQHDCDIPCVDHVYIDVIQLSLNPKKSEQWKSYNIRTRSTNQIWENSLGINMMRWYFTEDDIIRYWSNNGVDFHTLEVSEAHIYLGTKTKDKLKAGTIETETGVLLYALTIIATIFPTIKQYNYFEAVLENFEDVLHNSGTDKCKQVFNKRVKEVNEMVKRFVLINGLKKINQL